MSKLRNSLCELCTALIFFCGCSNEPLQPIRSGEIWPDNNGEHINAHGGGVMYHDGTYYWFGENKCDTTSSAMVGVMCYSSRNLTDWKNEGVALSVVDNDSSDIARGCIIRKSKFPQNPKRSVRFSGKRTKRSVQKRKARNTQKAETKVL